MPQQKHRQLAAILFTDMKGYSALMAKDEALAYRLRSRHREVLRNCHDAHSGEIIQYFGDGTLSIFNSAVNAVQCAIDIQLALQEEPQVPLRIGIHSGELVRDSEGIYGNAVNIASRLESFAVVGSILISSQVHTELNNHNDFKFRSLGWFDLKNVPKPVEIFAVANEGIICPEAKHLEGKGRRGPKKEEAPKKSIAVLPFVNMSNDPEQEYFSDGITEEIINALTKIQGLKVIARTSSFAFKNRNIDVRKIGLQLGVSTILEGSIRKAKDKVRITAQLINSGDGSHFWSENFDRKLTDIFELQDEISLLIAEKIRENFGHLDIQEHLVDAPTKNIEAYQYFLKGRYHHNKWNLPDFVRATTYYQRSIDEDPNFDLPYFGAGLSYSFLGSWGGMEQKAAFRLAADFFEQGTRLNTPSAYSYFCMAKHLFWGLWNYTDGYATLLKAFEIEPQQSDINEFIAEINTALGDFPTALEHIETSLRVNPLSPNHYYTQANIYYLQGQFDQALQLLEKALAIHPDFTVVIELKLACLIHLGLREELRSTVAEHSQLVIPELYELMFQLYHDKGATDQELVRAMIDKVQNAEPALLFAWDLFLLIYAGNTEEAMEILEGKIAKNVGQVINFKHEPFLEPLREFAVYKELIIKCFPIDGFKKASASKKQSEKEILTEEQANNFSELLLMGMEKEKYYLDSNLNLKNLANKIGLHPNKLSWLLNNKLEKHFNDFVNSYRLSDFKERAVNQKNDHLSLLGLAYESGFSSKSVFNDYFKKATGLTPKAWIKQHKSQ